ncbi:hypothetical protein SLEP1_g55972 [Rubroshorea leprosula]|uniref:Uncharacterized protein n=1 Tax=Rubroshorea leprosula TaxID=152421 RepID=A0AAV5MH70_9ROSI|nr:hypothetical protein SLEP1_g55972 [Rubroshorea leprosula]
MDLRSFGDKFLSKLNLLLWKSSPFQGPKILQVLLFSNFNWPIYAWLLRKCCNRKKCNEKQNSESNHEIRNRKFYAKSERRERKDRGEEVGDREPAGSSQ